MQFTANREQSSLNFFNFSKDKLLFIKSFLSPINFLNVFIRFVKNQNSCSFFVEKKNQKTTTFFVKKVGKKTTPFRIRNSLVKTLSLRGVSRSNLFCVDCFVWQHARFSALAMTILKYAMTIKNKFSILNLVKNFLTSITFDSLSRKIKNPCLVINLKLIQFKEEIIMYNFKKFFTYVVVGALVSALFIGCGKNPAEPGTEGNGGPDSVPTFTGDPATDLPAGYYSGTLSRKSYNISEGNKEEIAQNIPSEGTFYLKIANNKLKWEKENEQNIELAEEKEALKSGSEYGATILNEVNGENGGVKYKNTAKETVKFTISGDTISITYILGASLVSSTDNYSYDVTYEGTLTKYTPTTTPSGS